MTNTTRLILLVTTLFTFSDSFAVGVANREAAYAACAILDASSNSCIGCIDKSETAVHCPTISGSSYQIWTFASTNQCNDASMVFNTDTKTCQPPPPTCTGGQVLNTSTNTCQTTPPADCVYNDTPGALFGWCAPSGTTCTFQTPTPHEASMMTCGVSCPSGQERTSDGQCHEVVCPANTNKSPITGECVPCVDYYYNGSHYSNCTSPPPDSTPPPETPPSCAITNTCPDPECLPTQHIENHACADPICYAPSVINALTHACEVPEPPPCIEPECTPPPPDGGTGTPPDGGTGTPPDGGTGTPPDGGTGTPPDGGTGTTPTIYQNTHGDTSFFDIPAVQSELYTKKGEYSTKINEIYNSSYSILITPTSYELPIIHMFVMNGTSVDIDLSTYSNFFDKIGYVLIFIATCMAILILLE